MNTAISVKEYFKRAVNDPEPAYLRKHWVISLFSVVYENESEWTNHPYPYRLVRHPELGFVFLDPNGKEGPGSFTPIATKRKISEPLIAPWLGVRLETGDLRSINEPLFDSTYGDWLFNALVLDYAFKGKYPYLHGKAKARVIEDVIEKAFETTPESETERRSDRFYVDEYQRFVDAQMQMQGFSYLFAPAFSPKILSRDPAIPELRAKLLKENKDRLNDPVIFSKIAKELEKVDVNWVDDYGKDFLINKSKAFSTVRARTQLMYGIEKGFSENDGHTPITQPLVEGWDYKNLPAMVNSSREGSYNRGQETQLGGVEAKRAFRNFQNARIVQGNCGTELTVPFTVESSNVDRMVGMFYNENSEAVEITTETVNSLVGKTLPIRIPMVCKTLHTDYCSVCSGSRLAQNPHALGAVASGVGSQFLYIFMKKMHASNVKSTNYTMKGCLS